MPDGTPLTLVMDSNGVIYVENVATAPGTANSLAQVHGGLSALSASAFGREYLAISDLLHGQWCPLQYDGTFLDRVTQDGPGSPPVVSNLTPATATLSNTGAGSSLTIATVAASDPIQVQEQNPRDIGIGKPFYVTYYQRLTYTTTAPVAGVLVAGSIVSISGVSPSSLDFAQAEVLEISGADSFTIGYYSTVNASGTGGTVTAQAPTLIRQNNIVTANTSAPHGFQAGWQVLIAIANLTIGGGIAAIRRDGNGVVTVTTSSAHGLPIGANVCIVGVSNPDTSFNVSSVPVASVPSPTTFTYQQGGTVENSSGASGNVQDVWSGTFFIQTVPSPTTFTYQNTGPNDTTNTSGTATIQGQISPGTHQFVVMGLTRQGAITRPSPPVSFSANGNQQALFTNLPILAQNIVARIIGATGAGGDNFFTIPAVPQVGGQVVGTSFIIPDNTSTSAIIDFSDNTLFDSIAIDQPGNDLFDQRILIAPTGFFSYSSRLMTWGDYNAIQNLLNMGFGGGVDYSQFTNLAGSASNGGGSGTAWTNPSNFFATGTSNYATVTVATGIGHFSQSLISGNYGFAASGLLGASLTANFSYYYTRTGFGASVVNVFLLKAGVAIASAQLSLSGSSGGTAAAPLTTQLTFANPGLVDADVNASTFGFSIEVLGNPSGSTTMGANSPYISISAQSEPSGWSSADSTGGTFAIMPSTLPGIYQIYQMTSADGNADCMIEQSAYQDAFGTTIVPPNTQYRIRAMCFQSGATQGLLVWDLYSPTAGQLCFTELLAANMPQLSDNPGFSFAEFSMETPAVIPPDTLFRIYLSGVNVGGVVSVGENSLIYSANPYRGNITDVSYVLNPEGIAQTTGLLGSDDDPSPVMCFSVQRNVALLKSYAGTHTFQDNGEEPANWQVNNVSRSVGACSIRSGDPGQFGTGDAAEDWDITVNQKGMYLFAGGDFWKISQELDKGDPDSQIPSWQDANWSAEQTIVVKNDPRTHRIYVLMPFFNATEPNVCFVLDYKELDTATDLANGPSLKIGITGKMLSTDKTRKWCRWMISANCADILIRPGNQKEMSFAGGTRNGAAYGNVYTLDATKYHDDDYGTILPYYTFYGFVNHEQEQMLGLGTGRKLTRKFTSFVTGVGQVAVISFVDSMHNPLPSSSFRILNQDSDGSNLQNQDLEWNVGIRGERIFHQVYVLPLPGSLDVQMKLQKFVAYMLKDSVILHRSMAV